MADSATDLEQLYTPAASPFEEAIASGVQSTFNTGRFKPETQAMVQSLSGTNEDANLPTMPIGAGNQMYGGPMFSQSDIGNVSGVLKPEDKKMFIPVVEEPEMTRKEKRQERIENTKEKVKGFAKKYVEFFNPD